MKIIVCVKQVPNTTEIKIDPVTNTLKRDGVASIINPDDKTGLEVALQLKDKFGAHVTVISMGPKQAEKALGEALAMGADRAILLTDRAFAGADTLATSKTIAAAINTLEYDLIIAGRQAIDGDTAQVGPEIAEHLGLPQITYVNNVEYSSSIRPIFLASSIPVFTSAKVHALSTLPTLRFSKPKVLLSGSVFLPPAFLW